MSGKGAKKGGPKGGASQPTESMALFPRKPERTNPAPGRVVKLLTNMFKMSLEQKKPIYQYSLNVDIEEDLNKQLEKKLTLGKGDSKGSSEPVPRKLPKEIRRDVVDKAIKIWIQKYNSKDPSNKLEYNYLFDSNGSVIYTLFDMFCPPNNDKSQEFKVELEQDTIVEGKLTKKLNSFRVKLHKGPRLDLTVLFNYCNPKGTGNTDIATIQEYIRAVNVILRGKICTIPTNVLTPLSVFPFKKENQFTVSPGVLMNRGYSVSTRPAECGLVLNIGNTVAAFHEEIDLIELLRSRYAVRDLNAALRPDILDKFKKEIMRKQVEATHINYGTKAKPHYRRYRIGDIGGSSLDKFTLVNKVTKTTSEITIQQYFEKEYKFKLKYPKLPCVIDKGRKLPVEVCHLIEKQKVARKMDPNETSAVINSVVVPPPQHFERIKNNVEELHKNSQPLRDFGLDFTPVPIKVDGRELPPISLVATGNKVIRPSEGEYENRDRFIKPAVINKWTMVFLLDRMGVQEKENTERTGNPLHWKTFSERYSKAASFKGMRVPPASDYLCCQNNLPDDQMRAKLKSLYVHLNKNKYDHAIIVLPKLCQDWVYRYIQYLEVSAQEGRQKGENWTRTSCVKWENYIKKIIQSRDEGRMFISNLLLKHNTKMGGINYVLQKEANSPYHKFLSDGYIFISVDVCHPAPGDRLIQSVAAVVGMWDLTSNNMSYCTSVRVQKKQRENHSTIEDVGEIGTMVEEVLEAYKAKKKSYPKQVVILRDGVSEGQYRIVLECELKKVKASLIKKYSLVKLPSPPLTCLVVQKRHKVRFMRMEPFKNRRGMLDNNIQPGTVIDSTIVHPTDFSFYLAAHKAIKGTSRAAHIYIICDELKLTQDEAQAMVHALSYLSPRCNKSTSIPTPVNLADLAAERGKNIVISWNDDNHHKMSEEDRLKKLNTFLNQMADANYKNTLYYV